MSRHEIDHFGRDLLGRNGEIAFVLAIFIVYNNQNFALAEVFYGVRNGSEIHVSKTLACFGFCAGWSHLEQPASMLRPLQLRPWRAMAWLS